MRKISLCVRLEVVLNQDERRPLVPTAAGEVRKAPQQVCEPPRRRPLAENVPDEVGVLVCDDVLHRFLRLRAANARQLRVGYKLELDLVRGPDQALREARADDRVRELPNAADWVFERAVAVDHHLNLLARLCENLRLDLLDKALRVAREELNAVLLRQIAAQKSELLVVARSVYRGVHDVVQREDALAAGLPKLLRRSLARVDVGVDDGVGVLEHGGRVVAENDLAGADAHLLEVLDVIDAGEWVDRVREVNSELCLGEGVCVRVDVLVLEQVGVEKRVAHLVAGVGQLDDELLAALRNALQQNREAVSREYREDEAHRLAARLGAHVRGDVVGRAVVPLGARDDRLGDAQRVLLLQLDRVGLAGVQQRLHDHLLDVVAVLDDRGADAARDNAKLVGHFEGARRRILTVIRGCADFNAGFARTIICNHAVSREYARESAANTRDTGKAQLPNHKREGRQRRYCASRGRFYGAVPSKNVEGVPRHQEAVGRRPEGHAHGLPLRRRYQDPDDRRGDPGRRPEARGPPQRLLLLQVHRREPAVHPRAADRRLPVRRRPHEAPEVRVPNRLHQGHFLPLRRQAGRHQVRERVRRHLQGQEGGPHPRRAVGYWQLRQGHQGGPAPRQGLRRLLQGQAARELRRFLRTRAPAQGLAHRIRARLRLARQRLPLHRLQVPGERLGGGGRQVQGRPFEGVSRFVSFCFPYITAPARMEQKDERYGKLKRKAVLLLAANKQSAQLIAQLKFDFRAAFLGLVNIFLGTSRASEIDRIAELGHRMERLQLMLTDFACQRDKNQRNFLDSSSKAVQTDRGVLKCQTPAKTQETAVQTVCVDNKLVEQVSSQVEQLGLFFERFEQMTGQRYTELRQRLRALEQRQQEQSATSCSTDVLLEIRRELEKQIGSFAGTGPVSALIALQNRVQHLDTVLLAAKSQILAAESRAQATFGGFDAISELSAQKDAIVALYASRTEDQLARLSSIQERLIFEERRLDSFNEHFMSSSQKARVVQQQRDECVEELTALCAAVRGYKDREEQMRQKYDEKMMVQQQEILRLREQAADAEERLQKHRQLLADAAGLLECDEGSVVTAIQRLQGNILQLRLKLQRPADEAAVKSTPAAKETNPPQDARASADLKHKTQDSQMQAATLGAQLRTCEQELRMALDSLQFYEAQYNQVNLFLNDRGISVVNSDLAGALFVFQHSLLENVALKVLEEAAQIGQKLSALQKAVQLDSQRCENWFQQVIGAAGDKVLLLVLAYEQQLKSGHLALQHEKKCSGALIDALMRFPAMIQSIDLGKLGLIWRRISSLQNRLERTQIAFIALSRTTVEISAVNRYSGRGGAPK